MARGIDRQVIFRDDHDREDLLRRIANIVAESDLRVYAWALMSNHFHLLVKTGPVPLEHTMRSLLTGYAVAFNRRHDRVGHLFQNRYKSIICEADRYFLELVRYIHLNPLRAGVVGHVDALDEYPYTGHATLVGSAAREWQCVRDVLATFGRDLGWARAKYRKFVGDGVLFGRREDLSGGGLVRSAGGWKAVIELKRGREVFTGDERILGGNDFVDRVRREAAVRQRVRFRPVPAFSRLVETVCHACGLAPSAIDRRGRGAAADARAGLAYLWVDFFGQSGREMAIQLGLSHQTVYRSAKRGRAERNRWLDLVQANQPA